VELPWPIEEKLIPWLSHDGGKRFFALPPKENQEALSGIRNMIGRNKENFALVTRSGELRPFIRRLVEFEFPDVMVLSQDELNWPLTASPVSGLERTPGQMPFTQTVSARNES
jgi:type III secretory pathway component EscV